MHLSYVLDRYKIQEMCDKSSLQNGGTLESDSYKNKKTCNEAAHNYGHALDFVLDCYKTQTFYNKNVNTFPFAIQFVPECYKIQKMCDKAVDTCFILFLINIRLKKCVKKLFLMIILN